MNINMNNIIERDNKKNYILLAHTKINYVKNEKIDLWVMPIVDKVEYNWINANKLLSCMKRDFNFIMKSVLFYHYGDFYCGVCQNIYPIMSSLGLRRIKNYEKNISRLINEINDSIVDCKAL